MTIIKKRGAQKVSIPINADILRSLIESKFTLSDFAMRNGISRQSLHKWLNEERIPPRMLSLVARETGLSVSDIRKVLYKQKKLVITLELI